MAFQNAVEANAGFGVPGELYDNSPTRAREYILASSDADNNVVGATALYVTAEGKAGAGSTGSIGVFAGILANPKVYASNGTAAGGSLAPTLLLRNGELAEAVSFGHLNVTLNAPATIGDKVVADVVTGELSAVNAQTSFTGVIAVTTGVLTVSALAAGGYLAPGAAISGTGIPAGTIITGQITGTTGSNGTYQTNIITAVASTTMTADNGAKAAGATFDFVPNATVFAYDVTAAGIGVIELTN